MTRPLTEESHAALICIERWGYLLAVSANGPGEWVHPDHPDTVFHTMTIRNLEGRGLVEVTPSKRWAVTGSRATIKEPAQ